MTINNQNGNLINEKIWSEDKNYYEVTAWHPNGQISRKLNMNEQGVIIGPEIHYDTSGKQIKAINHN